MSGVALALASALLFGGMSVALGFSMRRSRDALVGAFATALSGFFVCAVVALVGREWGGELWPFMLAGLLAPGGAQLLFVLAVREAGPARSSVIAGAAPLVAVTIAIVALGEPAKLPLIAGAVLIVAGGLALIAERDRPESFRMIGLVYSFGCVVLFATRDNVVRHIANDSTAAPQLAASVTILSGTVLIFLVLLATRHRRVFADIATRGPVFHPAGPALGRVLRVPLRGLLPLARLGRQPAGRDRVAVRRPARRPAPAPHRARRTASPARRRRWWSRAAP